MGRHLLPGREIGSDREPSRSMNPILPQLLAPVHASIRHLEQLPLAAHILGAARYPEARGDPHLETLGSEKDGLFQGLSNLSCLPEGRLFVLTREDDHILIATVPYQAIVLPEARADDEGDLSQHLASHE